MDVAGFGNEGAARVVDEKGSEIKDGFFHFLQEYVSLFPSPFLFALVVRYSVRVCSLCKH
jgi:hypothetical protein